MLPTIEWKDEGIVMIDQRKLPSAEVYVTCTTASEVARAIKTMVIRGAPAIGVAAAMGIALGMRKSKATGTKQFATEFQKTCDLLAATRPTAVNLFWAIDRMKRAFAASAQAGCSVDEIRQRLDAEARAIHDEDVASCRTMGAHGATLVPQTASILTHCNAGALATAGYGTALGVIRAAVEQGKKVAVLADETRPFLQGARLTAWELVKDGIDTTVITDNMAASMMRLGHVDLVVVGADRIAANGDVAGGAREGARHSVLCRRADLDRRPRYSGRRADPDRGAQREGSDARRQRAAHAGRRPDPESGVRRDACQVRHRDRHRARHRQAAVR
jgi:methylthioribose-1-phosphate isomerase